MLFNSLFKKGMAMKTIVVWIYILIGLIVGISLIRLFGGKSLNVVSILKNMF